MIEPIVNRNPKALNLEAARMSTNKVIIGFTCSPELKIMLAEKAIESGITLSKYVEELIIESDTISKKNDQLNITTKNLETLNGQLKKRKEVYENDTLKQFYSENKGQVINYINPTGNRISVTINDLPDIYNVIINSFKSKK